MATAKKLMLASLIIQSLDPNVLGALTQQFNSKEITPQLLQNHYAIEGSYEDRISAITCAFRKWLKDRDYNNTENEWYGWWSCYVLGISETTLIFCYSSDGGYNYRRIPYTVGAGGEVTFSSDVETIDVNLVVSEVITSGTADDGDDADGDEIGQVQAAPTKEAVMETGDKGTPKQQDAVNSGTVDLGVDRPVEHSDDGVKIDTAKKTDAEMSGASVPDVNDAAKVAKGVSYSGDEGVGEEDENGEADTVKAELANEEAGTKTPETEETGANVETDQKKLSQSKVNNPAYLLQGSGFDQSNNSLCWIEQSTSKTAKDGTKLLHIQGIATRADIISKNGIVYPLDVWEQNIDPMNTLAKAGKFVGKLEHPDQEQGLLDTAILFKEFTLQGSDVHFKAVVPNTEAGKELQALIEAGAQIDLSSRGYGTAQKQSWRGQEVMVIQSDFTCIGFDAVHFGASTGSGVTEAQYQSEKGKEGTMDPNATQTQSADQVLETKVSKIRDDALIQSTKAALLATSNLNKLGQAAYAKALSNAEDLKSLVAISETALPIFQSSFGLTDADKQVQSTTWSPAFINPKDASETAPKTVGEMLQRLVADLPDVSPHTFKQGAGIPNHFTSPRKACLRMLQNMAQTQVRGFNGPAAVMQLLALENGQVERAQNIFEQSLESGATTAAGNVDPGGAPLSAPLIFPLVRRVYPRYIMNEIASIQPMDRPEGKIFYLDAYRTNDPTSGINKRLDLNTSSNPFNSSYGDNSTEGSAAQIIQLSLQSITVTAYTKKLGANWSLEEMQDLRAYHGLDAAQELMSSVAREMALEWNLTVLNDMLANATAASLNYGTLAPATGFPNQIDWDAYIWNYIQKLDNAIFSKRNGPMTHIVAGVDAALALAKSGRMTFGIGGDGGGDMEEQFPGAVYYGVLNAPNGSRYKVLKTNFWGAGTANGSKILGLRRGTEWSDTPYVWAPYTDYVTPTLTDPADFSQKQGIISRAAKQVVVGDAMGVLTVNIGSTGAVL